MERGGPDTDTILILGQEENEKAEILCGTPVPPGNDR